jgi:serine/threonine protein kinase
MDLFQRAALSFYQTIAVINEPHQVYLVQHLENHKIYVKKVLTVYSSEVYRHLKANPVPGIPQVIDFFEDDKKLVLIEEYIPGVTLEEKMAAGTLTESQVERYMVRLCDILENLHTRTPAIIHRDIKPSNILITGDDQVVLLDFNASRHLSGSTDRKSDTVLLGTVGYAAPEQFGFGQSTPRTDLYALGIILREACASLRPVSHKFDSVIDRCTQIDPANRYSSAAETRNALLEAAGRKPVSPALHAHAGHSLRILPPGFRALDPGKMFVAFFGYLMTFWLGLTLKVSNASGRELWINRIIILIIVIGDILIGCNYLDIRNIFPPCRSKKRISRTAGIIGLILIHSAVWFFLLVAAENIIRQ